MSVTDHGGSESVSLSAAYSSDPKSENYAWSQASPSGTFQIMISNPAARGQFKPGEYYFLDIAPAAT